jgi:hypothetical protein
VALLPPALLRTGRARCPCIRLKHLKGSLTEPGGNTTLAVGNGGPFAYRGKAHTLASVHLLSFLQGLVRLSCHETPEGSQLAFARGDLATPIHPITGWPSLLPSSHACRPIGLSCDSLSLAGGRQVYHVPREYQSGEGLALTPVVRRLREETAEFLYLTTYRFGPSLSASLACRE